MSRHKHEPKDDSSEAEADYNDEPDLDRFDNLKIFAYGEIFVVFGIIISLNDWVANMWRIHAGHGEPALFGARITLFILLFILMFRWIIATIVEFEMWERWLKHPYTKQQMYVAVLGLPVVGGLLLSFTYNIVIVSGIMTIYLLVNCWTQWLCNDHFKRAIHKTRQNRCSAVRSRVLSAMEPYWFKRPQLARIIIMTLFSTGAFSLALAGTYETERLQLLFQLGAYSILILDIIVGELIIAYWRHRLDQDIEQAKVCIEGQ